MNRCGAGGLGRCVWGALAVLLGVSCGHTAPGCPTPEFLVPPHPADEAQITPARIHVLVDGSGSMAGYFAPGLANNHYRTLLRSLRDYIAGRWPAVPVDMSRFGHEPVPLDQKDEPALTTARFYSADCGIRRPGGCDIQQSVIGKALREAEGQAVDDLSLVFTDLFLTDDTDLAEGADSLKTPLYQVLNHGDRSVGVLGIETAFRGRIYDMPHAPLYVHKPKDGGVATTRPVFVIMIGRGATILQFYQALRAPFLNDLHEHQRFVFYGADWSAPVQTLAWSPHGGVAVDHGHPRLGLPVYKVSPGRYEPLTAEIAEEALQTRYGTVFDSWSVHVTLWTGRERDGCELWDRLRDEHALGAASAVNGTLQVRMSETAPVLRHLPAAYLYALQTEVIAGSIRATGPNATLDDWNLDPDQVADAVRRRPAFFPALNLKAVTGFLERTSRERFRPLVVARDTVVLSLD